MISREHWIKMVFRFDRILWKRTRLSSTTDYPCFHYLRWALVCVSHGLFWFFFHFGSICGDFISIHHMRKNAILQQCTIVRAWVFLFCLWNISKMDLKWTINIINIQQIYTIKLVELNNSFVVVAVAAVRANLFNSAG